jgi:hypothetical protein
MLQHGDNGDAFARVLQGNHGQEGQLLSLASHKTSSLSLYQIPHLLPCASDAN